MSKSCRRNGSGELDVFEAALYFSGEVKEASLIGIQRTRRVAERRSVDAPPSREAMEAIFHRLTKSESKPKNRGDRQHGKLANFIRSFFNLVISRKKKQRKSRERDQKSTSLLSQREISVKSNKCCHEKGEALVAKGEWHGKTEEEDDGGSDSSSDLFELRNYAMGVYSSKPNLSQGP
ncbi:uncharacterized protein LOC122037386 [Zingiber officinale]|uniref:uncharacterized protein LOC122037386 n=1 Tax=Zingiber officinale TaxID=94328 RepID=UPI001C4C9708|nr:uncharacterized protein LOC122037386 [Zingiber officinale]